MVRKISAGLATVMAAAGLAAAMPALAAASPAVQPAETSVSASAAQAWTYVRWFERGSGPISPCASYAVNYYNAYDWQCRHRVDGIDELWVKF